MRKEKPEVGDIWEDKITHSRMVFVMVSDYYCEYLVHCEKLCESFDVYQFTTGTNKWRKGMKYLGKSKVSIEDLFKTEDENDKSRTDLQVI